MQRAIRIIGWCFLGIALLGVAPYVIGVALAGDRTDFAQEWASPVAVAIGMGVVGLLFLIASRGDSESLVQLPPAWITVALFAAMVGLGYLTTTTGWATYLAPLLATVAVAALGTTILRVTTYWARDRQVSKPLVFPALFWSMIATPAIAAVLQLALAAAIIGAIAGGLYVTDPSLATGPEIRNIFDDLGESRGAEVPDLYSTPTVALALFTLLAVVAPFTEELLKGLGVLVAFRRRVAFSERDVFVVGICAGLGFAVVEALGYSLIDVDFWPSMMLLRAPVIVIHVAATLLFARGWYLQKTRGGLSLGWYYAGAVALHGLWNGLFVAALILASAIDDPANPDPFSSALLLAVAAGLAVTWLVSVGIVVGGARSVADSESGNPTSTARGDLRSDEPGQPSPDRLVRAYQLEQSP